MKNIEKSYYDLTRSWENVINANIELVDKTKEKDKEIERLNNIIEKLEQENAVLKTQVVNKDRYSYGIRGGVDKE